MKLTDDEPNKLAIDEIQGYIERNTKKEYPNDNKNNYKSA